MSLDKIHGEYHLSCDICGEGPQRPFESFDEAVQYKRDNDWKSSRNSSHDWQDACPDCVKIGRELTE